MLDTELYDGGEGPPWKPPIGCGGAGGPEGEPEPEPVRGWERRKWLAKLSCGSVVSGEGMAVPRIGERLSCEVCTFDETHPEFGNFDYTRCAVADVVRSGPEKVGGR